MIKLKDKVLIGLEKLTTKAKDSIEIVKLKAEISELEKTVNKYYQELGMEVYTMFEKNSLNAEKIREFIDAINEIKAKIIEKQNKLIELEEHQKRTDGNTAENYVICSCGTKNTKDSRFCVSCGTRLEQKPGDLAHNTELEVIYCECGTQLKPGSKYCTNCGKKVA